MGVAFSEPRILALGYALEQCTRAWRSPVHTPALEDSARQASTTELPKNLKHDVATADGGRDESPSHTRGRW